MDMTWSSVKEVLFAIGSVAGVLAFLRPLVESKFQRDSIRVERIKSLVNEQRTNQEVVRFSGPLSKTLSCELSAMLASYSKLREFIQVNEWEPINRNIDGTEYHSWIFNKSAFEDRDGIPRDYAQHLDQAAEQAVQMKKAFQRFQLVAELHLFEVPLARWLLPRRFKEQGL